MTGKEYIVVGCCNRGTYKQLGPKFHRLPKEETRRNFLRFFEPKIIITIVETSVIGVGEVTLLFIKYSL